jgi:hypothetical protein
MIIATYNANPGTGFQNSASVPVDQQVNQVTTATALSTSASSSVFGQAVTFTATVSATNATVTPTGTASFFDGTTLLGTVLLSGGMASYSTTALSAGDHPKVTATYNPTADFTASTSAALDEQITPATTSIALSTSGSPAVFGQAVTFTANVSATNATVTPTGTVGFFNGSTLLGTVSLSGGIASLSTTTLAAGDYPNVTATYNPTSSFKASTSAALDQKVTPASTSLALTGSGSPSVAGQLVTYTATVSATNATVTPSGTASFFDGTTLLGTVALSGGMASYSTTALAAGDHPKVTATYNPTADFTASTSAALDEQITPANTSIALSTSGSPAVFGQGVTLAANVSATNSPATPTGTVGFFNGSTLLGTVSLSGGMASYSTTTLAAGDYANVTATYNPTSSYKASTSAALDQKVTPATTSTALTGSGSPSVAGQLVTYTAAVSATNSPVTPTGFVTFFADGTPLGVGSLSGGAAALSATPVVAGSESITATYSATANFTGSTTAQALSQQINPAAASQMVFGQQPVFSFVNVPLTPGLTVRIEDPFGNLAGSNASVTVALGNNPSAAALGGTTMQSASGGIATFTGLTISKKGSGYTLTASSSGLTGATSAPFAISSATHLTVSGPVTVSAGAPFKLTVTAIDVAGKIEPNYRGTIQILSTDPAAATLVAQYTFTASDQGKHTFTGLVLHTAGKVIVSAGDSQRPTIVNGTHRMTVAAAAAAVHHAALGVIGIAANAATSVPVVNEPAIANRVHTIAGSQRAPAISPSPSRPLFGRLVTRVHNLEGVDTDEYQVVVSLR